MKGLEALEEVKGFIEQPKEEPNYQAGILSCLDTIEKELKALEIILEHYELEEKLKCLVMYDGDRFNDEEVNELKEVLKNE